MDRYLITQSLLSSWLYTFDCAEGFEEDAHTAFLRALNREPSETTEAMQNGLDFEREVYRVATGSRDRDADTYKWDRGIRAVADIIRGAQIQVRISRQLECCGMTFVVNGVLDALKAGIIYDVKFLNKSMDGAELAGKYLNSPQHPAYFHLVPEAQMFQYLVSDGRELYIETYERAQTPHIREIIEPFVDALNRDGLMELYREKWRAK